MTPKPNMRASRMLRWAFDGAETTPAGALVAVEALRAHGSDGAALAFDDEDGAAEDAGEGTPRRASRSLASWRRRSDCAAWASSAGSIFFC